MAGGRAGHRGAQLLRGDGGGVGVGDQAAAVHDAQGVGQADQFVQVGGDQQYGQALAPGLADLVPDLRLGADVHAPGGVRGDQQLGPVAHLAADDQLLLVASGQGRGGHLDAGGADVVLAHDPLGVAAGRGRVEEAALAVGALGDVAQDAVLPERGLQQQAVPVPVLRDVADAALAAPARRELGDLVAVQADPARVGRQDAHDRLDEFRLAVALDTRDAEDLALVDGEGDPVQDDALDALQVGLRQVQTVDGQHRDVGDRGLAGLGGRQLAADHQLRELLGGRGRRVGGTDRGAPADDGDLVGDGEHLAQLVGDEDDRQALGLELAQVVEERVDLLRDEDRGRLVEDQRTGAAEEDLQDLDALTVGDTEVLHQDVRAHPEAVGVRDLLDLRPGPAADAVQLLAAEDDVLEDGEVVGEHEVLVHHADAAGDGVARVVEGDPLAVDGDGALVRLLHAVEDLHQRRLAGAVLAHEGVHRATANRDVDVVVGHDAWESLGDAAELHGILAGGLDASMAHSPRGKERGGRGVANVSRGWASTRVALPDP